MSKKDKSQKRPIDRLREGAGSMAIKTPDDNSPITTFISFGDTLLVVKELGIYSITLADKIDPERKNINIPNTIQKVLPFGSSEPWVGATLLTANDLLKPNVLSEEVDAAYAMSLVVEISQNISSAMELAAEFERMQSAELNKYDLKVKRDRSVLLPSMSGIENRCKEFLQKVDHAMDCLFKVVKTFYPKVGKGGWERLQREVISENVSVDNFEQALSQMLPFLHFARNARNCVEHPRADQRIIIKNFSVDVDNNLQPPVVEVVHPKTSQPSIPVQDFMNQISSAVVNVVELMLAFLCNRHIRTIKGFPVQVHEFSEGYRTMKNVKYGYGIAVKDSIIRFG